MSEDAEQRCTIVSNHVCHSSSDESSVRSRCMHSKSCVVSLSRHERRTTRCTLNVVYKSVVLANLLCASRAWRGRASRQRPTNSAFKRSSDEVMYGADDLAAAERVDLDHTQRIRSRLVEAPSFTNSSWRGSQNSQNRSRVFLFTNIQTKKCH